MRRALFDYINLIGFCAEARLEDEFCQRTWLWTHSELELDLEGLMPYLASVEYSDPGKRDFFAGGLRMSSDERRAWSRLYRASSILRCGGAMTDMAS